MSKMKLKIGEFSQMMQVTVKTLRHYEQKRLLLHSPHDFRWSIIVVSTLPVHCSDTPYCFTKAF